MRLFAVAVCLMFMSCFSPVRAAVVVVVGNRDGSLPTFNAGTTGTLSVWAYEDPFSELFPATLDAYDLFFDLGNDGKGIPGNPDFFTGIQVDFSGRELVTGGTPVFASPPGYDLYASNGAFDSQPNLPGTLLTAKKLFDINFTISSSTIGGTYEFVGVSPSVAITDGGSSQPVLFQQDFGASVFGKFKVNSTAVPEPSTMTMLALGLAGGVACRRFRKRSPSQSSGTNGSEVVGR